MSRAIAYYRVSTQRQGRSGLGIAAQRAAVARFAEAEGIELIGERVEIETAREPTRSIAGLNSLLPSPKLGRRNARCLSRSWIGYLETWRSFPG